MIGAVRRMSSLTVKKPWKIRLPARLRGGFIEKWGDYWVTVAHDYKEVAVDTARDIRDRPLRASLYLSFIGSIVYGVKTNPDEMEFQDRLQKCLNESAILSEKVRNEDVNDRLNYLADCYNHGLIRRLSLGVTSVLWIDNYSKECGVFKSQCEFLKPRYLTFHERVVDVGCLGHWRVLERMAEEYDVNHKAWPQSDPQPTTLHSLWHSVYSFFNRPSEVN